VLTEVYQVAGREQHRQFPKTGKDLWQAFRKAGGKGWFAPSLQACLKAIRSHAKPNDVILVMGAGSIDGVARKLAW
jgi:UDP-N-acetylmuramate-alanine ligase